MLNTPEEYIDSLNGDKRLWLCEFITHMKNAHPDINPIMFRQRPMYKVGNSYVLFAVAKEHFSIHTLNFDLLVKLKEKLKNADYGKGCIKVKFKDVEAQPILKNFCDEIIQQNSFPDAPKTEVVIEAPYEMKLANAFSGVKAKWLPLYESLRDAARVNLLEFVEYFPAVNVLWKHTSTFLSISAVSNALRIEFFSDSIHTERLPIKTLQTSKYRVAHTVELTDNSNFANLINWISESYSLTIKK